MLLDMRDLVVEVATAEGRASIVDGASLHVAEAEAVGLVGESGCGKTMTLKAAIGLLPPSARVTSGRLHFAGMDLRALSERDWQRRVRGTGMSMVFQDPMTALNPVFTIGEQLVDVYRLGGCDPRHPRATRREAYRVALEWLQRVRIPKPEWVMKAYPSQLSGGMRQRVLIALALITRPRLVIADEPGTALDVSIQDQIMDLLRELIKESGTSILFVTHDLGMARSLCDRIYVMYAGRIVEQAVAEGIFKQPLHPYTNGLLESIPRLTGVMGPGIDGMLPDYFNPPPGCRYAPRCPLATQRCVQERPVLRVVANGHEVACHLVEMPGGIGA